MLQGMRTLNVVFYKPKPDDVWLNKLVSFMSPPYSHCDLLFDDGVACSIYQNECVYQEKKTLSRKEYVWLSLTFTEDELLKIRAFCDKCHKERVDFDFLGMLLSYLPYSPRNVSDKTFCSRFVWEALQQSGRPEFLSHNATTMTPSRIFNVIENTNKNFLNASFKRLNQMK